MHLENGTLDWTRERGAHDSGVAGGRSLPVFKNEDSCFHTYVHVRLCVCLLCLYTCTCACIYYGGRNNYQLPFEVRLRYHILYLHKEYGSPISYLRSTSSVPNPNLKPSSQCKGTAGPSSVHCWRSSTSLAHGSFRISTSR